MEEWGKSEEEILESLKVFPGLFINEVVNMVDDSLDEAFDFFALEAASTVLKSDDATDDRSLDLKKGVSFIRRIIQSDLNSQLKKWEDYCLEHCFHVPQGISFPPSDTSVLQSINAFTDKELDKQLNSLRDKLTLVNKESAELVKELHVLEGQSFSSNQSAGSIDEILQLHKKHDATQMFQELATMTSEFRSKLAKLKRRRMEEIPCDRAGKRPLIHGDTHRILHGNGLSAKLEELEELAKLIT